MPDERTSALMQAVSAYKKLALDELGQEPALEGVRLLKELNRRVQSRNLLTATLAELKAAGTQLFAAGDDREASRFLSSELRRFYAVALEQDLLSVNPLTGEAKVAAVAETSTTGIQRGVVAAGVEEVVAAVVEEGIQAGLTLSPLALPLAEMGGRGGALQRLVDLFTAKWSRLACHLRPLLLAVRVVIPVLALILVLAALLSDRSPLRTGLRTAAATDNAIDNLTALVEAMDKKDGVKSSSSLRDLGRRVGVAAGAAAEVFDLQRAIDSPPTLYVRHKETGELVVLAADSSGSLRNGTWRMQR